MTEHHSLYDKTTNKWTLPSLEGEAHEWHTQISNHDVSSAESDLCSAEWKLAQMRITDRLSTPDHRGRSSADINEQHECISQLVANSARLSLERAWIYSVGKFTYPTDQFDHVKKAQQFANKWLEYFNARETGELQEVRDYEYTLRLRKELRADRTKVARRFVPKGVKIVDRLSSPKKPEEMTAVALFTKLRNAVTRK